MCRVGSLSALPLSTTSPLTVPEILQRYSACSTGYEGGAGKLEKVVLELTASGAELVAGAVRNHNRAAYIVMMSVLAVQPAEVLRVRVVVTSGYLTPGRRGC
jgi:hypothetical protein